MSDPFAHFIAAQEPVYATVIAELSAGHKQSHWMWFVFPQLAALGKSPMAKRFGLADLTEARTYLNHPVLGPRLRGCTHLMLKWAGRSARDILGQPDDMKLRSCLTLFARAAQSTADRQLFEEGLKLFFAGEADPITLKIIGPA